MSNCFVVAKDGELALGETTLRSNNNNDPACRANMFCIGVTLIAIGIAYDNKGICKLKRIQRCGCIDHWKKRIP